VRSCRCSSRNLHVHHRLSRFSEVVALQQLLKNRFERIGNRAVDSGFFQASTQATHVPIERDETAIICCRDLVDPVTQKKTAIVG
jgi:serine/threonine protein phosphatase PrpC